MIYPVIVCNVTSVLATPTWHPDSLDCKLVHDVHFTPFVDFYKMDIPFLSCINMDVFIYRLG